MLIDLQDDRELLTKIRVCLLFGAVFPVAEPWKTFRCFLYLCERCSLVLETSSAHAERNDRTDLLFEVWIFAFESSLHTDNF